MAEVGFAIILVIVGFLMIILGQQLMQFLGIILMSLAIGGGVFADLRKPDTH